MGDLAESLIGTEGDQQVTGLTVLPQLMQGIKCLCCFVLCQYLWY